MCTLLEEQNSREDDDWHQVKTVNASNCADAVQQVTPDRDACYIVFGSNDDQVEVKGSTAQLRVDTPTSLSIHSASSGYEGTSSSSQLAAGSNGTPVSTESAVSSVPTSLSSTTESDEENDGQGPVQPQPDLPEWMVVGESVRISPDSKLGVIAYVGNTDFAPGTWIGVVLDSPTGKNDGTVNGVTYFTCKAKFGIFVRPDKLKADPKGRALRQAASRGK